MRKKYTKITNRTLNAVAAEQLDLVMNDMDLG